MKSYSVFEKNAFATKDVQMKRTESNNFSAKP